MQFDSLTMVPRNLKEAIDWLLATEVNEDSKIWWSMGQALTSLFERQPAGVKVLPALEVIKQVSKDFLEQKELRSLPFVKSLLQKFYQPKSNTTGDGPEIQKKHVGSARGVGPRTMARSVCRTLYVCDLFLDDIKHPDQYTSAYDSEVTWFGSCKDNPEACAVVFVGIAPMLYAGLRSLKEASKAALEEGPGSKAELRLAELLKAVGYDEPECKEDLTAPDVHKALRGVDMPMLYTIYDFAGVWGFY
ncbi:hypothetical protein, conserved [Babesia ovata]|uniref:Uncharacterized protein n=1 Tax=Babesia ovata TaxID=189622 RepID=A0A2H6K9E5_9APIC|nr:uncharacterized protein BOVATA_011030 [Babesia ovata]GBE59610.1 hypothetical protein, conserved [Babesia ovata]